MQEVSLKRLVAGLFSLSAFVFIPEVSWPSALLTWLSVFFAVMTLVAGVVSNYFQNRTLRLTMVLSISLVWFISWSLRSWMYLFGLSWSLVLLLVAGLVLSGALPFINQKLAEHLYWEGFAPKTKIGKAVFKLSLALGPSIGVLGALFGLKSKMPPVENKPALWILAILMYLVSSCLIFYNVYEYANNTPFRWKPWRLWRKKNRRQNKPKLGEEDAQKVD